MRIIGGEFRSRLISFPDKGKTRPTKDRIREAVFSSIADRVPGAKVLDLFAGSGAYGLEALSRGAGTVYFVENAPDAVICIHKNIKDLNVAAKTRVFESDAFDVLRKMRDNTEKFDIIFADPPFNRDVAKKTLLTIRDCAIFNELGLLILEHNNKEIIGDISGDVTLLKEKSYADIIISVFTKK